jgi:hypothetical protein
MLAAPDPALSKVSTHRRSGQRPSLCNINIAIVLKLVVQWRQHKQKRRGTLQRRWGDQQSTANPSLTKSVRAWRKAKA